MTITIATPVATRFDATNDPRDNHNDLNLARFAREMTLDAFGFRAAWTLDQELFIDRQPDDPPIRGSA